MIRDYFESPSIQTHIRGSSVGPYLDGYADALAKIGYSPHTIRGYLRMAAHLGCFADQCGLAIGSLDGSIAGPFRRHLSHCSCGKRNKGLFRNAVPGVTQLLTYLRSLEVIAPRSTAETAPATAGISDHFAAWMIQHRGVTSYTRNRYQYYLSPFLAELGEDPARYDVASIRAFVIKELGTRGPGATRSAVTAIRAFLRFLVAEGRVAVGTEHCVPTVPLWRLSSLPRYLEDADVERVVQSCDLSKPQGLRDHAIVLLLARLGLRGGDIVAMMLSDVDWIHGTLRVLGKGRRETLLPLPQEVGDAVLAYLERGRPRADTQRMFVTVHAPIRPFATSATVSDTVRFALLRAGIHDAPTRGAHLLRHSAATSMLRAGSSLDTISTVLRHQSQDMTAYYAKVDLGMLRQVAQPWPGGAL